MSGASDGSDDGARRGTRRVALRVKLLWSVGVGVVVFGVSSIAAYHTFRGAEIVLHPGRATLGDIHRVRDMIEAYREEHQALPDSLRDLPPTEDLRFERDERGAPVDWWDRPLQYSTDGSEYEVTSYGRDGEPGGAGFDADLSTADIPKGQIDEHQLLPLPQRAVPTYQQFVRAQKELRLVGSSRTVFVPAALAGVVAFLVAFVALVRSRTPMTRDSLIVSLILTTVGALFAGAIMGAFHLPTGH